MLVLTRRVGQTLKIGDGIRITILADSGNRVRIGIDCPDHIEIVREELLPPPPKAADTKPTAPKRKSRRLSLRTQPPHCYLDGEVTGTTTDNNSL